MTKLQFRVLYREFLFRMVDLEMLSSHAQGDMSRLFGQFAALLLFLSILFCIPAAGLSGGGALPVAGLIQAWALEHFLIATTMLVVGLFAVLTWDSTFPNLRDVLVLAPLPVRVGTMFLAKIAGVAAALGLTVLLLHSVAGLLWPIALNWRMPAQAVPALTTDPAMPPVTADRMQAVLSRDLDPLLRTGALAPATGGGVAIGVSSHGVRRVFAFGAAKADSIFEVGSLTKTFTGLALAQMAVQGKATLDEPVRELLPAGTVGKPAGQEITLADLATHHSGLPRMPGNMNASGSPNPGADYHAADLYQFLVRHGVAKPGNAQFLYSNLGYGLLGEALANRSGTSYARLIEEQITNPLGMRDTVVSLSSEQQSRMIQAYDVRNRPVAPWDLDALAGAGALRSTAGDMLMFLEANLDPQRFASSRTVAAALVQSQELRAAVGPKMRIALAWIHDDITGTYWHNGAISGYTSHAFFNPKEDYAAVVLMNQRPAQIFYSELLARHIQERLRGEPAVSFQNVVIPANGGVWTLIRGFVAYWVTMISAGGFVFCCVLGIQGLAAQLLPRRLFLRMSSWMQLAAFCLFLSVYFLQPMIPSPDVLIAAQGNGPLAWSPSYWFLGLFQQLNGSPAFAPLAHRAWAGLGIAVSGTAIAYTLSYFRTLRKIVEEPDIAPGLRGDSWLPRFGSGLSTAIVQFSVRSLLRSRRHRIILAFYLGIAFAMTIFILRSPGAQRQLFEAPGNESVREESVQALAASIVILTFWIVGTRVVFSLPLDMRANWIFRIMPIEGGPQLPAIRRRSLLVLSAAPAVAGSAMLFLCLWPWRTAAGHVVALGFLGMILVELCLQGAQKIPFACSYLPGRSNFHLTFWICIGLLIQVVNKAAEFEHRALGERTSFAVMLVILGALLATARWRTSVSARSTGGEIQFEDAPEWEVQVLGISGDGAPPSTARL